MNNVNIKEIMKSYCSNLFKKMGLIYILLVSWVGSSDFHLLVLTLSHLISTLNETLLVINEIDREVKVLVFFR